MLTGLGMLDECVDQAMVTYAEEDPAIMSMEEFVETDILLTLDSGCCDHIVDIADCPGYACVLGPSPGSKRGQKFVVGNGGRVKNQGQVDLQMGAKDGSGFHSVFQVAEITRPLMSVSRICDQDLICIFDKTQAQVLNPARSNAVVATFERDGGLYTCSMRLRAPKPAAVDPATGFTRPE